MKQLSLWFALLSCTVLAGLLPVSCTKENGILDLKNMSNTSSTAANAVKASTPAVDPAITFTNSITVKSGKASVTTNYLVVMNTDGSNKTSIYSSTTASFGRPSWSPDGKHIVFISQPSGSPRQIYTIDVSVVNGIPKGSNLKQIPITNSPSLEPASTVVWSPNGDKFLFNNSGTGSSGGLYTIPIKGGTATLVYTPATGNGIFTQCWSPTADSIAFEESTPNGYSLRMLDLGTHQTSIILPPNTNFFPRYPVWSRHGDRIAIDGFNPNVIANPAVYTIAILGPNQFGAPKELFANGICPAWSPDDSKLEYYYSQQTQTVYSYDVTSRISTQLTTNGGWGDWRSF